MFSSQDFELAFGVGSRVRISSKDFESGVVNHLQKVSGKSVRLESKWNPAFWVVPAESFREQCSKFRWENEMVPFRKLQKTWAVIRGDAFFYCFSL